MKHSVIIACLCECLEEGQGIATALAEINLTIDYLADKLTNRDRVKLHQAHNIYVEKLRRALAERARTGRSTKELRLVLDQITTHGRLELPGDDNCITLAPIEVTGSRVPESSNPEVPRALIRDEYEQLDESFQNMFSNLAALEASEVEFEDEDDDLREAIRDGEVLPPSPPQEACSTLAAPAAPEKGGTPTCSHLRAEERPSAPKPPEAPPVRWKRLFTGRAVATDENGKVIKSLMPGAPGYPHESDFDNSDRRSSP